MKSIDDYPNVLVVPNNLETPEDIIEDYIEIIEETKGGREFLRETLQMFFEDANLWTARQMMIDQAKMNIQHLQELDECVYDDDLND